MMPFRTFASTVLLTVLTHAAIQAQTAVSGDLREGATGAPIEGALVVLQREGGEIETGALTGPDGQFRIRAGEGGRYRLRAERIGYSGVVTEVFDLVTGETRSIALITEVDAIKLDAIDVSVESQCRTRPEEGSAAYSLWEQAEKALRGASVFQDHGLVEYTVRTYRREVSLLRGRTRDQREEPRRATGRPFRTLAPEVLADGGYARPDGEHLLYYGPDVKVLLSDSFRDTHCFGVEIGSGEPERLIGLAFEPVGDRGVADIAGVMWLDRETGELSHVSYEYTGLDDLSTIHSAGGYVAFERLPVGAWIVRSWWIRVPEVGVSADWLRQGERREVLHGYVEAGGELTEIKLRDGPKG